MTSGPSGRHLGRMTEPKDDAPHQGAPAARRDGADERAARRAAALRANLRKRKEQQRGRRDRGAGAGDGPAGA